VTTLAQISSEDDKPAVKDDIEIKDPVGNFIKQETQSYQFHTSFAVSSIDLGKTGAKKHVTEFQNRMTPIEDVDIDSLTDFLRNSTVDVLPVILWPDPSKPNLFKIVDGHHRVAAYKRLGRTHIPAYVLTCGKEMAKAIALRSNMTNGKSDSPEDRVRLAVRYFEQKVKLGQETSVTTVAKLFNLPPGTLSTHLRARDGRKKLIEAGATDMAAAKVKPSMAAEIAEFPSEQVDVIKDLVFADPKLPKDLAVTELKQLQEDLKQINPSQQQAYVTTWAEQKKLVAKPAERPGFQQNRAETVRMLKELLTRYENDPDLYNSDFPGEITARKALINYWAERG